MDAAQQGMKYERDLKRSRGCGGEDAGPGLSDACLLCAEFGIFATMPATWSPVNMIKENTKPNIMIFWSTWTSTWTFISMFTRLLALTEMKNYPLPKL